MKQRKRSIVMPTAEKLYERCELVDDCIEWRGPYKKGFPAVYVPSAGGGNGGQVLVRRLLYEIVTGRPPGAVFIVPRCGNQECVSFDHMQRVTYREMGRRNVRAGVYRRVSRVIAITKAARSRVNNKLNEQKVAEIMSHSPSANGGKPTMSSAELAAMYGVSSSMILQVWRGRYWVRLAPAASVFSLAGAA